MSTTILNHPLIDHKLTIMRNKETGTKEFRQNLDEIAMLMAYEVTQGLPVKSVEIAMLSLVGLAEKYKSYPRQLSGGEQQRVALARALVNSPDILLADEPTGNLDPKISREIMKLLEEINARGTTVVVVTHDENIVNTMKKRVIRMQKGIIVGDERESGYIG